MDRKEQHRQQKDKAREQKNKQEAAYEDKHEVDRPAFRPVWLLVLGIVLTIAIIYIWTVGMW
jgi:hypothetical protein